MEAQFLQFLHTTVSPTSFLLEKQKKDPQVNVKSIYTDIVSWTGD